ncbi:MAG: hypothetical protein ACI845_003696 [Gammaproteobacteria bacterium]|jgi:hypothetical protein
METSVLNEFSMVKIMNICRASSIVVVLIMFAVPLSAAPLLQLYVEGAEYDYDHESWVFEPIDANDTITLWVIGNVDGPGGKGTIHDVNVTFTYADVDTVVNFNLTPTRTDGLLGFSDSSTPVDPAWVQTVDDGSTPVMADGHTLAPHDVYGAGWEWQQFALGDFSSTDSQIEDFIDTVPTVGSADPLVGQINAYEISIDGDVEDFHIDAFGFYENTNGGGKTQVKATFAPYSHDAGTGINSPVSEPSIFALFGLGFLGLGFCSFRRNRKASV